MLKEPTLRRRREAEKTRSVCSFGPAGEILKNTMRTRLTLQPHQDGAKQLLAEYGDRLVCVRYRYDERRKRRLKTVELIVEENDWEPRAAERPDECIVHIKASLPEVDLQRRVKAAGGSGMGFFLANKVAEFHGGWVELDSPTDNWSTEVRLVVPVEQPALQNRITKR